MRTRTQNRWDEVEEDSILEELSKMVDDGLLSMGVNSAGESVFWPTPQGERILGMLACS